MDIKELQQKFIAKEKEIKRLEADCLNLRNEFKAKYPAAQCPVYLARQSGLSKTALFWRHSSQNSAVLGKRVDDFWQTIDSMEKTKKIDLAQIEYQRIKLNYLLSVAIYKKLRLKILIENLGNWLLMVKKGGR